MAVISFLNQKGGSSKSTSCVHFAVWLKLQGKSVRVIDTDAQRSATLWLDSLEDKIACLQLDSPDDLLEQISDLDQEQDFLLIDGPAKISEVTRAALLGTDLAVLPLQPTGLDIAATLDTVRLIRQARKVRPGKPKAALFVSRAIKGTKLKDEALATISSLDDMDVLKSVIHQRQVIADAFGQSGTVFSIKGRAATDAAREYQKLFVEILEAQP